MRDKTPDSSHNHAVDLTLPSPPMVTPGYIYVLINPAMPDLCKVGKTTRDPRQRVNELSAATGVPQAFILAYWQAVDDCDAAERAAHLAMERAGYRLNSSREFFTAPLAETLRVITPFLRQMTRSDDDTPDAADGDLLDLELDTGAMEARKRAQELYEMGCAYREGSADTLVDEQQALRCFEQSAALGHGYAALNLGWAYLLGESVKADLQKAFRL